MRVGSENRTPKLDTRIFIDVVHLGLTYDSVSRILYSISACPRVQSLLRALTLSPSSDGQGQISHSIGRLIVFLFGQISHHHQVFFFWNSIAGGCNLWHFLFYVVLCEGVMKTAYTQLNSYITGYCIEGGFSFFFVFLLLSR